MQNYILSNEARMNYYLQKGKEKQSKILAWVLSVLWPSKHLTQWAITDIHGDVCQRSRNPGKSEMQPPTVSRDMAECRRCKKREWSSGPTGRCWRGWNEVPEINTWNECRMIREKIAMEHIGATLKNSKKGTEWPDGERARGGCFQMQGPEGLSREVALELRPDWVKVWGI